MVGGGSFCSDLGVFELEMDFKEVMVASPPELAHCMHNAFLIGIGASIRIGRKICCLPYSGFL